jgi:hypothetical protein
MNLNDFDAILEDCIEQIAEGETSLDECLLSYPEYAEELAPVLLAATALKRARDIEPSPFLRRRIRAELNHAMKSKPVRQNPLPTGFWRLALNIAVLVFALITTNTVFAQGALPGESLYNWKLTSERIWRFVSVDPLGTDLQLSNRRINEYVAVSNDETRRARVLTSYNELLVRFKEEPDQNNQARIVQVLHTQQDSLRRVGLAIPELDSYFSNGSSMGTP